MMDRLRTKRNHSASQPPQPLDTVVTFLEMTAPPAHHPPRPANINAALLVAKNPPLHFYRYLYFHVGIQWNWESRLRFDDEKLAEIIHAETTDIHVLSVDGAPAGFFEINRADPQTHDIAYFGMMPHVFGRGLGRWFLGAAIESAWMGNPDRITVNTCTLDHPAALPLYQKMGFSALRQAPGRVVPLTDSEISGLYRAG